MYILGIVEGHNCSAALLKDGELVAVCFEEGFPGSRTILGIRPAQSNTVSRAKVLCLRISVMLPW